MYSRHLVLLKAARYNDVTSCFRRALHKLDRRSPFKIIFKSTAQSNKCIPNLRYASTKASSSKKSFPLIVGAAVLGGVIGTYALFYKRESSDIKQENEVDQLDIPFVHEHLEEDLNLLKEFGKIPYLLIGAGSASFAAYKAIRILDPTAKVLMIGDEPVYPYIRPPLSKEMWFNEKSDNDDDLSYTAWDGRSRSLLYEPAEYFFTVKEILEHENGGVSIIRGTNVIKVDPVSQVVYLDKGGEISYNKCLIATGSKPKNIQIFESASDDLKKHITLFRTVTDFQKLHKLYKKIGSVVVVGGGFLGSELAYGLAKRRESEGFKVTQVFPESGNIGKVLPEYLSMWTTKKITNDGVKVIPGVTIKSITKEESQLQLQLSNGEIVKTDHVVVAVGSEANTEIAKASGLEVDENIGGFVVNTEMEARKNLWVAGDASCFYDTILGRRRVEHHDNAIVSGGLAGRNMAGAGKPYEHQSMFWSDLGPDLGFEAIGIVDSTLPTVGIFAKDSNVDNLDLNNPNTESSIVKEEESTKEDSSEKEVLRTPEQSDNYSKGVLFYLKNDVIVGIVLWNTFGKMSIARRIINESKSYDDLTEVAKLFELHSKEE